MASEDALTGPPVVTLLTDFGVADPYVGVMKGVILAKAPSAQVVDLTHEVPPQQALQGALLLETAWRYFPPGTVHVAVVDPGVGTARARLAISSGGHYFVGPDNGLLSSSLPDGVRGARQPGALYESRRIQLPADVSAVVIDNASLFRHPVSSTFEGRDVFAPAAAHLASGGALSDLGHRVTSIGAFPAFRAPRSGSALEGLVLHVDRFGNLITDIRPEDSPPAPSFRIAGRRLALATTYETASGPSAIVGSSGFVEIAVPNGSAARVLGAGTGDVVTVE